MAKPGIHYEGDLDCCSTDADSSDLRRVDGVLRRCVLVLAERCEGAGFEALELVTISFLQRTQLLRPKTRRMWFEMWDQGAPKKCQANSWHRSWNHLLTILFIPLRPHENTIAGP